jgi:hypothetical protein
MAKDENKKTKKGKGKPHWLKGDSDENDLEKDPHEGDRGEAKREGKKVDESVKAGDHDCEKVHPNKSHKEWEAELRAKGKDREDHPQNYTSQSGEYDPHNENVNITRFIQNVMGKNYAEANKYLQVALEDKMRARISNITKK